VKRQFVEAPGYGHQWTLWRTYLNSMAPMLFQEAAAGAP
jgi:hypothetical protein